MTMPPGLHLNPALLPLMLAAMLSLGGCGSKPGELTVSGRIEVDDIHIGSKIGGRVEKVNCDEGDRVEAGAVAVALDARELTAQLEQAKASLAKATAQLDLSIAGPRKEDIERAEATVRARQAELELRKKGFRKEEVREAEAQQARAKSDLDLAEKEFHRAETLFKSGTIDRQELDRKRAAYLSAQAQSNIAEHQLALVRSGSRPEEIAMADAQLAESEADLKRLKSGSRPEEIATQRAAVEEAKANVARLESQLAEMNILAPSDAMVETLDLKPGDLVKAGETVAVLNLMSNPYVRCYVPENRLGFVKPGMKVSVTVDSFPGETFPGIVRRVNSQGEFTPRNVQTTEKRAELVFEMKVDITEEGDRLRAGMYADVHVPSK